MQSFLVRLRIAICKGWTAVQHLFHIFCPPDRIFLLHPFQDELHQHKLDLNIIWAMLETLIRFPDEDLRGMVAVIVHTFASTFSSPFLNSSLLKTSLDLMVKLPTTLFGFHDMCMIMDLVKMLTLLPPKLLTEEGVMVTLSALASRNWRDESGRNLLNYACTFGGLFSWQESLFKGILLLLLAGCDPDSSDQNGRTLLHLLAHHSQETVKDLNIIASLLLDFGATLGRKDVYGKTAVDLWIQKNCLSDLPEWCAELPTLMSLSVRTIRLNRVPYSRLPPALICFVEKR